MGMKEPRVNIDEIFKKYADGSGQKLADKIIDVELDESGGILGTGRERDYKGITAGLFTLNTFLLDIFLGVMFPRIWLHSPILRFIGGLDALIMLIFAQIGTAIWFVITGHRAPMLFIYEQFPFGNYYFRSISSLVLPSIIILDILQKTYSKSHLSKKTLKAFLMINLLALLFFCFFIYVLANS
jgi:hypothetical protein